MHLRRALLLFAVVLGLAALAASLSRPRHAAVAPAPAPSTEPRTAASRVPASLSFDAGRPGTRRALAAGRAATATVRVTSAGQVEIVGLGVVAPAEPLTPATFDLDVSKSGRYPVVFLPAAATAARPVGTLVVR